jgi:hypothetical protein
MFQQEVAANPRFADFIAFAKKMWADILAAKSERFNMIRKDYGMGFFAARSLLKSTDKIVTDLPITATKAQRVEANRAAFMFLITQVYQLKNDVRFNLEHGTERDTALMAYALNAVFDRKV